MRSAAQKLNGHPSTAPFQGRQGPPHRIFNVNSIVVSPMKSCDDALTTSCRITSPAPNLVYASEKAIVAYCHLMHLLICLSRAHPVILQDAERRVWVFLASPENHTKRVTPNMGELIVVVTFVLIMAPTPRSTGSTGRNITATTQLPRSTIAGPYREEAVTRSVRWVLRDAAELEVMEQGASDYRLSTTFSRSRTSLRLIMFQITFLDVFLSTYHPIRIDTLDRNSGFPEPGLPARMVEEIKVIYGVGDWPACFEKAQFARRNTKGRFLEMLKGAVGKSEREGYHRRKGKREMERLERVRKELKRARVEAVAKSVRR